jgi:hypothetical protein
MATDDNFPHNNWYIEITEENKELLNKWKIKQKYSNSIDEYTNIAYIDGEGRGTSPGWGVGFLITTEQFKKYVLKEPESPSDYTYLINLLKKINNELDAKF